MAFINKIIFNPKVGQQILFSQTSKDTEGSLLEMVATYHEGSGEPPSHYHPFQAEDFKVISGEMNARINDKIILLKQGDTLHISPNTRRTMWNSSS